MINSYISLKITSANFENNRKIMKKILLVILLGLVVGSCSTEDDVSEKTTNHDIVFSVSSTDNSRLSNIDFNILGSEQEVKHSSYSNTHLPLSRTFLNHKVNMFTNLGIGYTDNSGGAVGESFEPYTVTLEIRVDTEVKAEKDITITESGQVDFVTFSF